MTLCLESAETEELIAALEEQVITEDTENLLRNKYPTVYIAFLKSLSRTQEAEALYDGKLTVHNMSWYIHSEFLPRICRKRREGKLVSE